MFLGSTCCNLSQWVQTAQKDHQKSQGQHQGKRWFLRSLSHCLHFFENWMSSLAFFIRSSSSPRTPFPNATRQQHNKTRNIFSKKTKASQKIRNIFENLFSFANLRYFEKKRQHTSHMMHTLYMTHIYVHGPALFVVGNVPTSP